MFVPDNDKHSRYSRSSDDHLCTKNPLMSYAEYDDYEAEKYDLIVARDEDYLPTINKIIGSPIVYHQNELLSKLSGAVMTEDMYNRVEEMLKSSDEESKKLAIESMASCDFQKSAVYLLLLLYHHSSIIQYIPSKNHANFKSLLRFFNLRTATDITEVDGIINALKHQKLFNLTNLNILMPLVMERIRERGDMENILIKDVELAPEAEAAIAENILDSDVGIVEDPTESVLGEL
jgi:hypothetical protein